MTRNKKLAFSLLVIVVLLFVYLIMGSKKQMKKQQDLNIPVSVVTADVIKGDIEANIAYSGNLEGREQATIMSQTGGVVEKVLFTPGQVCKVGQALVQVENSQQEAGVEQAKAQVMTAETNYEKAQKDLVRIERLYNDKVATKDNLELSQLNVKAAFAQMKAAQAGLKVADKQYSDTFIKATINGRIATKEVNLGQTVAPGVEIAKIVDDSEFKLKFSVPENSIAKLRAGQSVQVMVDAVAGKVFSGKVLSVGLAPEKEGTSYPVEVLMSRQGNTEIKSGMFARCIITTEKRTNTMLVPQKAITVVNNEYFVYVAEGKKASMKKVDIGLYNQEKYEILAGISVTDKVITVGKEQITDGSLIQLGAK